MNKMTHDKIFFPSKKMYNIQYSDEIVSITKHLLKRKKWNRYTTAEEVFGDPFFDGFDKE